MTKPIGDRKSAIPILRALLLGGVLIIGLASSARADSIYYYSGSLFEGSFTVPQPLPPDQFNNGIGITITPTSFSFTDGTLTIPESGATSVSSFFSFITDSNSKITAWFVRVAETKGDITVEFDTILFPSDTGFDSVVVLDNGVVVEGGFNSPGNWGGPHPAPEPPSLILLGTGLLGLLALAVRSKRLIRGFRGSG
jgi:hypothetical protein